MYSLIIRPSALEMAKDAYEWYEEQQVGLGELFLKAVDDVFDKLGSAPLLYSKKHSDVRSVIIAGFPYMAVYEVVKEQVIVYSIFHTSRRPRRSTANCKWFFTFAPCNYRSTYPSIS